MSQLEVIKFIEASEPRKKVDLMFKINDERGHIPPELFSLLRNQPYPAADRESDFSRAIDSMGFNSHVAFMEYIKPILA